MSAASLMTDGDAAVEVRPGDRGAATAVEGWLREYATTRDERLRERIIMAYLGLADRLAGRYWTCATPAGGCTSPGPSRNRRSTCARRWTSCTSASAARRPWASWPSIWGSPRRRCWRRSGSPHSRLAISLDHPASLDGDQNLGDLSRLLRRALGRMRTQLVEP